jgi:hypothetical protein
MFIRAHLTYEGLRLIWALFFSEYVGMRKTEKLLWRADGNIALTAWQVIMHSGVPLLLQNSPVSSNSQ